VLLGISPAQDKVLLVPFEFVPKLLGFANHAVLLTLHRSNASIIPRCKGGKNTIASRAFLRSFLVESMQIKKLVRRQLA
jgi:hypothetical protein